LISLFYWVWWIFIFVVRNTINRPLFKEKAPIDSHSIKQDFDEEKPDLAIFGTKAFSNI
jgi:glycine/serine hydroxymethyltransferase